MKIAFAGKGGVGKTTLCAWLGDYLARQGHDVLLVDADTALSLGQACGLEAEDLPVPLYAREDLIRERIGSGYLSLNPDVSDLPEELSVDLPVHNVGGPRPGRKRLLTMGSITGAGDGCACAANALLKSVLAHLVLQEENFVLVDLEAGVEHLGRGTVAGVDALVVVSEPSRRSLETAARVGALAGDLGLARQVLAVNRGIGEPELPAMTGLPKNVVHLPILPSLVDRQLTQASVLNLPDGALVDAVCARLLAAMTQDT
ncbi:CO dehydrogenase maturation factor [Desulfomicrobium norvegicum]|uniref:CO dehydrogenase maturation factor n=1 Tax=Desulfomicrobium norvegicum (strain DSM 1741 / NCIMB 8310) TaxID=52561 RepID=A0A8G2C3M5_DESNO|nr:AAA family ATPase [Desulfomicrobium norvegicum]SFL83995.1 CO dehydrogenase maturation factor [Desulfomicrobium norvegicum]